MEILSHFNTLAGDVTNLHTLHSVLEHSVQITSRKADCASLRSLLRRNLFTADLCQKEGLETPSHKSNATS